MVDGYSASKQRYRAWFRGPAEGSQPTLGPGGVVTYIGAGAAAWLAPDNVVLPLKAAVQVVAAAGCSEAAARLAGRERRVVEARSAGRRLDQADAAVDSGVFVTFVADEWGPAEEAVWLGQAECILCVAQV